MVSEKEKPTLGTSSCCALRAARGWLVTLTPAEGLSPLYCGNWPELSETGVSHGWQLLGVTAILPSLSLWKADFCSALMVSDRGSEVIPVRPVLPGRVPVYTCSLHVIVNGTPLLGAECPSVDSKLHSHLFTPRTRKSNNSKNEI